VSAKRIGDAVGDCLATRCLEAALVSHKLAHAYLLVGRDEDAKLALAAALAKSGNCRGDHGPGEFCDTCSSCRQVDAGGSSNIRIFGDSGTLNIDAVD
jgi:DNA polymerase III subunit gamma/tau